jgi:two-component system, NtrC family, sensor histidine kinase HydH
MIRTNAKAHGRLPLSWRIGIASGLTAILLLTLAYLLHKTSAEGVTTQLANARTLTQAACDEIRVKLVRGVAGSSLDSTKQVDFQNALLEIILDHYDGVEGGFWSPARDFESYAFPTYDGASAKRDVPRAEMDFVRNLTTKAMAEGTFQESLWEGRRESIVISACPIESGSFRGAAWTLMRVPVLSGTEFDHLKYFVIALLVLVAIQGLNSIWLLRNWAVDLRKLQQEIQNYPVSEFRELDSSREPDLQPIVQAFNQLNHRLKTSLEDSKELSLKLGQAERLTLLGKMAAGIAHEIRNPMATVKLKLENISVHPNERYPAALPILLEQVDRVDRLIHMLLAMTRPFQIQPESVNLRDWLEHSFPSVRSYAEARKVRLETRVEKDSWNFDAFHLGRALENLLHNAVAFAPEGSTVNVFIHERENKLRIDVRDQGRGLSVDERASLFQPFVSQRTDGTGLGLILAKEIAEAHGGTLSEVGDSSGACFRLEIPWQPS